MTVPPPQPDPSQYPETSQAVTALVLGILGLVTCPVLGPFAWQIGQKELDAIDEGRRPAQNRGTANAGKILGIVGTALLGISLLVLVFFLVIGGIAIVGSS